MKVRNDETCIVLSGYFNPLHEGHISMFRSAKSFADRVIVIVNNDKQVNLKKGSTPFLTEIERATVVKAIKYVDEVWISIDEDKTVCETLKLLNPDMFGNGGDRTKTNIPEEKICNKLNITMVYKLGCSKKYHSSKIKKRLLK